MKIAKLLAVNDENQAKRSIRKILGDGFLLKNNLIYRNVRITSETMGYKYVEAWPRYLTMPLLEIDEIIKTRKIPYISWQPIFKSIEKRTPKKLNWDEVPAELLGSYHIHESSHCISNELWLFVETCGLIRALQLDVTPSSQGVQRI